MKRIYSILLALCVSSMLSAQLSIWDGTDDVWTKGAGTESSPYLIESAQQLAFIASMVNGGVTTYENTYFKLMTNIDLNNRTWVPIGDSNSFKGHFDGNNKIIFNAAVYLFGYIKSAGISRLSIKMGGLAENAESSTIKNCSYKGNKEMIQSASNTLIDDCRVYAAISENSTLHATLLKIASNCVIKNCISNGSINVVNEKTDGVTGKYSQYIVAAGLVCSSANSQYYNCLSNCNVSGMPASQSEYATHQLVVTSGLIGRSTSDSFYYCSNVGNVSGKYHYSDCYDYHNSTICNNIIASCHIGIVGLVSGGSSNIKNSYSVSESLYKTWSCKNPAISSSDIIYSGSCSSSNSYSSANKTEQAMKSASFPIVLNTDSTVFVQDVTPNVNGGYPIYVNQVYTVTDALTTIGFTTAQLLGHYYALNADSVGFEYKEKTDNTHWYQSVTGQVSGNIITCDLSGLTVGTNYIYRVWVERDGVRYFGDVLEFTTLECSKEITPLAASICQGEEYAFNGQQLTQSGAFRDTLVASNGCDSIIELTLTVMPTVNIDKYDTIMVGESYDFYGEILTESGTYEHYVPMVNRCNLIILHLYVRQPSVVVTATSSDVAMGSVDGGGIYEKYSQVTLTAVPNIGCRFVKWTDNNTDNPRIITPTDDCSYTAMFEQIQYTLTVSTPDTQKGNVSGGGIFTYGQQASISAAPKEGFLFKTWSDGDTNANRTITIVSDSNLVASFEEIKCKLTLTANNSSMGSVFGAGLYAYGAEVSINAIPNTGYHFMYWSDNDTIASRTFTIKTDMSLTAYFEALKYMVVVSINDSTLGTVYGGGEYTYNSQASLMAVPNTNCEFVTWNNGANTNPYVLTVTDNIAIQAIFREVTEGVDEVSTNDIAPQKVIIDGQIYILRGEKVYTLQGQEVK